MIPDDAFTKIPVGGLQRTGSEAKILFDKNLFGNFLRVVVRKSATETNATQLTIPITESVNKGDVLDAAIMIRGAETGTKAPARLEFLFERTLDPWTKSVTQELVSSKDPIKWKWLHIPFVAAESYQPGQAMVSIRFATQRQTVDIGCVSVENRRHESTIEFLRELAVESDHIGKVVVDVNKSIVRQTLMGFGGDFCQPRYGSTEPMDVVGRYALDHLNVVHARIGFPLNYWVPEPNQYRDDAQAHAAILALKEMNRRHIPTVLTIWEGPGWMLGGKPEQSGRELEPQKYQVCIDSILRFMKTAKEKYGATADYFSFNEPDYGVNFKFTSKTLGDFIRLAGPQFKAAGFKTKFIVGDTAGGSTYRDYAYPLLTDKSISAYLGPLGFHCWDGLTASEASYKAIAALGRQFHKPVWCLEAGHDSGLWQADNPWGTWENALRTAMVYERTLRLTEATLMDYWTYQDNYPIVNKVGPKPYPVFGVIKQMENVCAPGSHVVATQVSSDDVQALVTMGPGKTRFAGMIINPKGSGTVVVRGLPVGAMVQVVLSDKSAQGKKVTSAFVSKEGTITLSVPARSVVTFAKIVRG